MTAVYVLHALLTALRTARFDTHAAGDYDHSFEGFFRSFFAAVISAPLYIFIAIGEARVMADFDAMSRGADAMPDPPLGFVNYAADTALYVVGWIAFPLAMIGIARLIGVGHRYVPYIVAYNWGTVVVLLATIPPYLIYVMGFATLTGFLILYYASVVFVLLYRWRLARDGLQINGPTAAGIVALDIVMSAIIVLLAVRFQRLFQ